MKRACLVALLTWLVPTAATAAPCIPGSLASYVGLGAGGCNIGSALFSNFVDLPVQLGATPIPDSSVFVTPLSAAGQPGFQFNVNAAAAANDLFERTIGFTLAGTGITGARFNMNGSVPVGDAANTLIENACVGASLGPGFSCGALPLQLVGFDNAIIGRLLSDSLSFAPVSLLGIAVDITVDGGSGGAAKLASVSTQFTQQAAPVPEPATWTMLALGLAGLFGSRGLRAKKTQQR